MNRSHFLKTSLLAGIGSSYILNNKLINTFSQVPIEVEHLLGLNPSHLKSSSVGLERETYKAFQLMKRAASNDKIDIKIVSGYRSFQRQKEIWERKFLQLSKTKTPTEAISEIITYSSIPGTSRHHWGTDIDIIDGSVPSPQGGLLQEKNYHGHAAFSKMKSWMDTYSKDFGFELVYTDDPDRTGFNFEPWHFSYAPKSVSFLKLQMKEEYKSAWENLNFKGKSDFTNAFINSYFKNYGSGINPNLMPS